MSSGTPALENHYWPEYYSLLDSHKQIADAKEIKDADELLAKSREHAAECRVGKLSHQADLKTLEDERETVILSTNKEREEMDWEAEMYWEKKVRDLYEKKEQAMKDVKLLRNKSDAEEKKKYNDAHRFKIRDEEKNVFARAKRQKKAIRAIKSTQAKSKKETQEADELDFLEMARKGNGLKRAVFLIAFSLTRRIRLS
jgi:hypothetical protein